MDTLKPRKDSQMDKIISPEFSRLIANIVNSMKPSSEEEQALKKYIKLILVIARKYVRHNVEYEDLIMHGIIGLIEAVRNFDPSRSTNFNAYAVMRMKGRMYEYCINNVTSVTVPTHVSKARVHAEKMTKMLEQEPYLFASNVSSESIIRRWEHEEERNISAKTAKMIRDTKEKVLKIAENSRTTYEELIGLAYQSMVVEISEECISNHAYPAEKDVENSIAAKEITEKMRGEIGDKKTAIVLLNAQEFNNEEISSALHEMGLTPRKISRQAVGSMLKSIEKTARKNV